MISFTISVTSDSSLVHRTSLSVIFSVREATLKILFTELPITSHWKRLRYTKATFKTNIVGLTKATLKK